MAHAEPDNEDKELVPRGGPHLHIVLALGVLYFLSSAGLIAFNKFMMKEGRFPFAVIIVLLHAAFSTIFMTMLYLLKPSLFGSLTDPERKVIVDRDLICHGVLPVAVLFSGQLVLSNTAYLHSSVAFLQMMKEGNLVLVYTFSLMTALERFSTRSFFVLLIVMIATAMTIHGELNFNFTGFAIQGLSQMLESTKIVLQAILLSNAGRKLDALTYVFLVMPVCFIIISALLSYLVYVAPSAHLATPAWHDVVEWWPWLLVNAGVALVLNIAIALFVKHSSAVAFILAGIVKDALIVIAGGVLFQEVISMMQIFGFTLQLLAILVWGIMKTFPEKFEAGIFSGFCQVLFNDGIGLTPVKQVVYGSLRADSRC